MNLQITDNFARLKLHLLPTFKSSHVVRRFVKVYIDYISFDHTYKSSHQFLASRYNKIAVFTGGAHSLATRNRI